MRSIFATIFAFLSIHAYAEIPEWYKRDVANLINKAHGVVIFEVKEISLQSIKKKYHLYRIETKTLEEIKGKAPKAACYFIQTEGKWKSPYKSGEKAIVILNVNSSDECGAIEPGFGAPGTKQYVSLFKSIVAKGT